MALIVGTRLGPHEILSALGAGGMGEVYRARDTTLDRDVALKILPASFANDPDRLMRFTREARTLASLNHPNIAQIYGVETADGVRALVMELVAGEDLSAVIARGPVAIAEALPIATQIADALEAAHEQGIIHRDLKPANIKVRDDGTVKVLDFGLAKALDPAGASSTSASALANSPTLTSPALTQMGMILGTAAYMAPEQARGRAVDKRADIWAFGVVLYEMLTGTRPFEGADVAETMGAVIHKEPNWARLPVATPPSIIAVLRRCLQKDPKQRLRDIGDVRLALDGAFDTAASDARATALVAIRRPPWRRALPVALAVVLTAILASAVASMIRLRPPSLAVTRSSFFLPDGQQFTNAGRNTVAMSPDGARMVYVANRRLYIRSLAEFDARPIPGSENFQAVLSPVFSPDGQSVAFYAFTDRTVKTIAITGGSAVTICPVSSLFGLSWGPDGIVFGEQSVGIMRVSPDGGTPEPIVRTTAGETAFGPELLPGGTHVLFTLATGSAMDRWDKAAIVVQSLASRERKVIVAGGSDGRYLPTGHLVYAVGGTLLAVAFDGRRLEAHGGTVPVVEGVGRASSGATGVAHFSVSRTGSLIYVSGPASTSAASQVQVALIDRKGTVELLPIPAGSYQTPRVSPSGKQIVLATALATESFLSVADLTGGTAMRRLTFGGNSRAPLWSRDGQRVAFQSDREGDLAIFWQRADGTGSAERLTRPEAGTAHVPESWTAKDETLLFSVLRGALGTLSMFSRDRRAEGSVEGTRSAALPGAALSPDGRWLAYTSYETGSRALNVEPFPPTGAQYQLAPRSGVSPSHPLWSADGKALVYTGYAGELEIVSVTTQPTFAFGNPVAMPRPFRNSSPGSLRDWDIAPDGKFLGLITPGVVASGALVVPEIRIVVNWFEELTRKMPTGK